MYEDGNELPPDDPDDFFVHVAFKLISSVIGVEKSKVFPSLCHSLNLYPLLVGFDGLVSFSPLLTSWVETVLPPSESKVTLCVTTVSPDSSSRWSIRTYGFEPNCKL